MEIELLYFEDCPNYQTALKHLTEVIKEKKLDIQVRMVNIESDEEAWENRFLGSPTIRVNDIDIEPGAQERGDFSIRCRLYLEAGKIKGWPSKKLVRHTIEKAIQQT